MIRKGLSFCKLSMVRHGVESLGIARGHRPEISSSVYSGIAVS